MPLAWVHLFRTQFYSLLTKNDVILAGDGAKAEEQMRRHIRNTADRTLPHFDGLNRQASQTHSSQLAQEKKT